MPIVIGPDAAAWNDPLNLFGDKPDGAPPAASAEAPRFSGQDRDDVINTVIAEAAGEGEDGMAAVVNVIRNRADRRGLSLGDVVRQPKQFTGYEAPGPEALKAMRDPALRERVGSLIDRALSGELPDATGGADHYHADSVSPGWAAKMPRTATLGRHLFYDSGVSPAPRAAAYTPGLKVDSEEPFQAVLRNGNGGDAGVQSATANVPNPNAKGLARLVREPEDAPPGSGGKLHFVHSGQDKIAPQFKAILTDTSAAMGRDFTINSGYRSPTHRVEAAKAGGPGEHASGTASDISMKGMDDGERARLVRELYARGARRFITYTNSPDMLHVDMKDQTGKGTPWFMHDKSARNIGQAPQWFQEVAANPGAAAGGQRTSGKTIVVGSDFVPSDPMGLMAGENPFAQHAGQQQDDAASVETERADAHEQARIAALNERHNAEIERLVAENPGKYELVPGDEAESWQQQWEEKYRSSGRMGDTGRNLAAGAIEQGENIDNLARLLINKFPGGEWLNDRLDAIDRWFLDGQTGGEVMREKVEFLDASRTEEGQASAAKTVFKGDTWELGDALFDPDWYLAGLARSTPAMVATMAPGGLLARGAYASALASGATRTAAAASAAKVATLAGSIGEGILGGAETARSVRDRIAALPREQILQSDAAQKLVAEGKSEDEAIRAISEDAQVQGFITAGVATGIFGGLGDRALAKIIAEGVGGSFAKRLFSGAARGAIGEGVLEELPQSFGQTVAGNAAMRRANPDQDLFEGGAEAAASGLAIGGVMGAGMGGTGGALRPRGGTDAGAVSSEADRQGMEAEPDRPEAGGPVARSVQRAEERIAARQPAALSPGGDLPEVGATVRVDAEGFEDLEGKPRTFQIESYEGDDALLLDHSTGEVYQVPRANITKVAPAIGGEITPDAGPQPINDSLPEFSNDPALEPAPPQAAELRTEPLPPASEQKPATERFPSAPLPGERVIVDDENGGRFAARVKSYEDGGTEAVVTTDDGKELQVPVGSLAVSKLTEKQVEAQELKRNPPVDRTQERAAAQGPQTRAVHGRSIVLPDERHARLYDLGRERTLTKRALGASQLDLAKVNNPELRRLADEFKVTPQAIEAMADDYRYRVERAAKEAKSDLPQRVAPVNGQRLLQWQQERAKAEPQSEAQEQSARMWWDTTLNAQERKRILEAAGVKRSEKLMWGSFTRGIHAKLEPFRVKVADGGDQVDGASGAVDETAIPVDAAAHEAATSPENDRPEPTQAQKEAEVYLRRQNLTASHEIVETDRRFEIREKADGAAGASVRVGDERAAGIEPARSHRADTETAANGDPAGSGQRGRDDAGASVAAGREDVAAANRDADRREALTPAPEAKAGKAPAVSENRIFTADAAERARALLRSKLNQLNSGIDPEIMQAGITLAGYHIERGARTFAAYASSMLADLGEVARPYLKSWYAAVVLDPRFSGLEGLTSLADVQAADLDAIVPPRESNEAMDEAAFVRTPDGSLDFGAITPEIANAIKR